MDDGAMQQMQRAAVERNDYVLRATGWRRGRSVAKEGRMKKHGTVPATQLTDDSGDAEGIARVRRDETSSMRQKAEGRDDEGIAHYASIRHPCAVH